VATRGSAAAASPTLHGVCGPSCCVRRRATTLASNTVYCAGRKEDLTQHHHNSCRVTLTRTFAATIAPSRIVFMLPRRVGGTAQHLQRCSCCCCQKHPAWAAEADSWSNPAQHHLHWIWQPASSTQRNRSVTTTHVPFSFQAILLTADLIC